MARFRQEIDSEIVEDGDAGLIGVNALLEPSLLRSQHIYGDTNEQLLSPGTVSHAQNKRFSKGHAEPRPGTVTPPQFNIDGGWTATIYGSGVFSDPNGFEWLMICEANQVRLLRDGLAPVTAVGFASGITIAADVEFVQAFDRVIMFRGLSLPPLQWDGDIASTFDEFPDPISVTFLDTIPNAEYGVVMAGRSFVPYGRDQVAVSDLLDYSSWDVALNTFRINSGEDDVIVGLHPYRRASLIVFKERSIHRLTNVEGDLSTVAADLINAEVGCVARKTIATVGGDIFWLGDDGVMRFSETVEDSMVAQEVPVSEAIQPWIDRINRSYIHLSSAKVHGRYYYLAVPLDNETVPSTILVYDTVTGQWQGMDKFPAGMQIDRLHIARWLGRRELISVDRENGFVSVHGHGRTDIIDGTEHQISDSIKTRGYVGGQNDLKRWRHANVELSTWNPSVTIKVYVEGVNEVRTLRTLTRDRTRYTIHGAGTHTLSSGATHGNPHREDYMILASDNILPGEVYPELEQVAFVGAALRDVGRWVAIEILNTQGSCSVRSVRVDGARKANSKRTYA